MVAEESAGGIHAYANDPRSRAELLATVQRQERELAVLASMVAARNNATVGAEMPQIYNAPSSERRIASYLRLSRQLASLGRTDIKRVLKRLRLLK
jgi:hypothetical protein